jgi:hypothetical protein
MMNRFQALLSISNCAATPRSFPLDATSPGEINVALDDLSARANTSTTGAVPESGRAQHGKGPEASSSKQA